MTEVIASWALLLAGTAVCAWLFILLAYSRTLLRLLREPVFRHPVLLIESDDWGAGPLVQAQALHDISGVLVRHHDSTGRAPVLNLAVVLAVPDTAAIRAQGGHHRIALDHALFEPVLQALREGVGRGVFALQLHGLEHYWPATLQSSADPAVQAWRRQPGIPETEQLPSPLQSRWVDTAVLPSLPHPRDDIVAAVADEVAAWQRVFSERPRSVVPPTFVWTRAVEAAWFEQGIEFLVTPGVRYTSRTASGGTAGEEDRFINGQRSAGMVCVVRTDYFEPLRGRDARHALAILARDTAQGRPCVLENHRNNFCGSAEGHQRSLLELDTLLRESLARFPGLRFLSTVELGRVLRARDPVWLVLPFVERWPCLWARLRHTGRLWKLMRFSGLAGVVSLLARSASHGLAR